MTKEEFKKQEDYYTYKLFENAPVYKCPHCGGDVYRDVSVAFMTYPPKYKYFCKECGKYDIF